MRQRAASTPVAAREDGPRLVEAGQGLLEATQAAQRVGVPHQAAGHLDLPAAARKGGSRLVKAGQGLLKATEAGEHAGAVHHAVGRLDLLAEAREDGSCLLETDESLLETAQAGEHAGAVHRATGRLDLLAEARVEGLCLLVVGQGIFEAAQRRQAAAEHLGHGREARVLRSLGDLGCDQRRELRQPVPPGRVRSASASTRREWRSSQVQCGCQAPALTRSPLFAVREDVGELGVGAGADVVTQLFVVHLREVHVSPLPAPAKEPPPVSAPSAAGEAAAPPRGGGCDGGLRSPVTSSASTPKGTGLSRCNLGLLGVSRSRRPRAVAGVGQDSPPPGRYR